MNSPYLIKEHSYCYYYTMYYYITTRQCWFEFILQKKDKGWGLTICKSKVISEDGRRDFLYLYVVHTIVPHNQYFAVFPLLSQIRSVGRLRWRC